MMKYIIEKKNICVDLKKKKKKNLQEIYINASLKSLSIALFKIAYNLMRKKTRGISRSAKYLE